MVGLFRWFVFVGYLSLFLVLPFFILWDTLGLILGTTLLLTVLTLMAYRAPEKILNALSARPLPITHHEAIHFMVKEYARRLEIVPPKIESIESTALNAAIFGLNPKRTYLVLTTGLIQTLSRPEVSAILARTLTELWSGSAINETWYARLSSVADSLLAHEYDEKRRRQMASFLSALLLFPFLIVPRYLLAKRKSDEELDKLSLSLCKNPRTFTEALQKLGAYKSRFPLSVPFSTSFLFLTRPQQPLRWLGLLFPSGSLSVRLQLLKRPS